MSRARSELLHCELGPSPKEKDPKNQELSQAIRFCHSVFPHLLLRESIGCVYLTFPRETAEQGKPFRRTV